MERHKLAYFDQSSLSVSAPIEFVPADRHELEGVIEDRRWTVGSADAENGERLRGAPAEKDHDAREGGGAISRHWASWDWMKSNRPGVEGLSDNTLHPQKNNPCAPSVWYPRY